MIDRHEPEIFTPKPREPVKRWQYVHEIDPDGRLVTSLVDNKGVFAAVLYWIDTDGRMHLSTNVGSELVTAGYTLQGLQLDTYGCIETTVGS